MNEPIGSDRGSLEREIVGALKSAIDAHGPITRENVASAAKRAISAIKSWERRGHRAPAAGRE